MSAPDLPLGTNLLTHLDQAGRVKMVDVSHKQPSMRRAVAFASILVGPKVLELLVTDQLGKGDAWAASRLAAIMAAKKTAELIPLTHPIRLDSVRADLFAWGRERVGVFVSATAFDRTGVEMEAMVAASTAMLNLYDMVKGVDKAAIIEQTRLVYKSGGKSGTWQSRDANGGRVLSLQQSLAPQSSTAPDQIAGQNITALSIEAADELLVLRSADQEADAANAKKILTRPNSTLLLVDYELSQRDQQDEQNEALVWCESGLVLQNLGSKNAKLFNANVARALTPGSVAAGDFLLSISMSTGSCHV